MVETVILTGVGGNVSLGGIKPLKALGYTIIGTDVEDDLSPGKYLVDVFSQTDSALLDFRLADQNHYRARINEIYISKMRNLCEKYDPCVVIPNPDPEVLALCKFRKDFPVLLPSYEQKLATFDKYRAYTILEKNHITTPEFLLPLNERELEEYLDEMLDRFNVVFTNARASRGGENSGKIWDFKSSLKFFYEFGHQLLLEYLPGREYAVVLVYRDGKRYLKGAFQKLKYGCGQGLKNITVNDRRLFELAEKGVEAINKEYDETPNGTYHVDIKEDNNKRKKVMEINAGRAFGGTPDSYIFYAGGINLPHTYIRLASGEDVKEFTLKEGIIQLQMNNYVFVDGNKTDQWASIDEKDNY